MKTIVSKFCILMQIYPFLAKEIHFKKNAWDLVSYLTTEIFEIIDPFTKEFGKWEFKRLLVSKAQEYLFFAK